VIEKIIDVSRAVTYHEKIIRGRVLAENSRIELGKLRRNDRRNVGIFFLRALRHSLWRVSVDFAIIEEMDRGQLHLAATNRPAPRAHRKRWEGGEETTSEAQYQVPRTVIRNGYSGIVYSSGD
jgi:hypothetical protein